MKRAEGWVAAGSRVSRWSRARALAPDGDARQYDLLIGELGTTGRRSLRRTPAGSPESRSSCHEPGRSASTAPTPSLYADRDALAARARPSDRPSCVSRSARRGGTRRAPRKPRCRGGRWKTLDGRIASCASWALRTLVLYWRVSCRQELLAVAVGDQSSDRLDRRVGQGGRVGTHVGDVTVLVEALRHLHRAPCREAQLAVRLLLQGRRHERRCGVRGVGLLFDRFDSPVDRFEPGPECRGVVVAQPEVVFATLLQLAGCRVEVAAGDDALVADANQLSVEDSRRPGWRRSPSGPRTTSVRSVGAGARDPRSAAPQRTACVPRTEPWRPILRHRTGDTS